jgi:hypothetical protein
MKKGVKNRAESATAYAIRHKTHNKMIHTGELVPLDLMEKPDDAKAKQRENTGMPSDFWL